MMAVISHLDRCNFNVTEQLLHFPTGREVTADHREQGGLAGAVRADDAQGAARGQVERQIGRDDDAAEPCVELDRLFRLSAERGVPCGLAAVPAVFRPATGESAGAAVRANSRRVN